MVPDLWRGSVHVRYVMYVASMKLRPYMYIFSFSRAYNPI